MLYRVRENRPQFTPSVLKKVFFEQFTDKFKPQTDHFFRYRDSSHIDYPEQYDKGYNTTKEYKPTPEKYNYHVIRCSPGIVHLQCTSGHEVYKVISCGREWCEDCGKKDSLIHKRRVARWYGKYHTFNSVGYMVVTIPKEIRHKFKTKFDLANFRTYIRRKLKSTGITGTKIERAFIRYHYAGDCKICKGKECERCNYTGADSEWNPHINILFESGFIPKIHIEKFKNDIAKWLSKYTGIDVRKKGNVNYSYTNDPKKKNHKLSYVVRSTLRIFNPELAAIVKGFRTGITVGKWKKEEIIQDPEQILQKKCCPACFEEYGIIDSKLKTYGVMNREQFKKVNYSLTNGGVLFKKSYIFVRNEKDPALLRC